MKLMCPTCGKPVALDDVDAAANVGTCRYCGRPFEAADVIGAAAVGEGTLRRPPPGVTFEQNVLGFRIRAPLRSPMLLFLILFATVWLGMAWTMTGGGQALSAGHPVALFLFGFGAVFLVACVLMWFGQILVVVERGEGRVFTGIGPIGRNKRFRWEGVREIREREREGARYSSYREIFLEGRDPIGFGGGLTKTRRHFVLQALRQMSRQR